MHPSRVRTPRGSEERAPRAQRLREQPGRYRRRVARRHRARDIPAAQAVASALPPAVAGVVRPCSARSVRLAIESGSAMAGPRRICPDLSQDPGLGAAAILAARYAQAQRTARPIRGDAHLDAETVLTASEAKAAFGEEARPLRAPDCPAQPEAPVRLPMLKPSFPSVCRSPLTPRGAGVGQPARTLKAKTAPDFLVLV